MCKKILSRIMAVAVIVLASSCASYHNHVNPMEKKVAASTLVHGTKATEYRRSEMIGAGIGALGNSLVVDYQNRLESDLRHKISGSGFSVQREGHVVRVLLPAGMTFDRSGTELRPESYPALDALAGILEDYRQTMIEVIGYTDADQPGQYRLPEQRASEISSYLVARNLRHERFEIVGLGRDAHQARSATMAQAEIRLIPLQRTISRQPRDSEIQLVNTGFFVAL